jgi:hypothetical protein
MYRPMQGAALSPLPSNLALRYVIRNVDRLEVFENRVPRKIVGPTTDKITGELRRLHNEELYDLY